MNDDEFKVSIINNKKVSVWGLGYLGYTTLITLQKFGFDAVIYDFNEIRLKEISSGLYPSSAQFNSWTLHGEIPRIDLAHVEVSNDLESVFENKIHIISFPDDEGADYESLAAVFVDNRDKIADALIIFQSAGMPNNIEMHFCNILNDNGIEARVSTVFRGDWTIEEYFNKGNRRVISGNSNSSIERTSIFLEMLDLEVDVLDSIEGAELYENSKIALNYVVAAFYNQISLAYPDVNINSIAQKMLSEFRANDVLLGVNSVGYKSEQAINNLNGAAISDRLSILKEANGTNVSFMYYYIDLLKSKNIKSVTIIGLSSYGNLKDIRFSPSIIMSEILSKEGLQVYIYDENIDKIELASIMPYAGYIDIDKEVIHTSAVVIMNLLKSCKYFTQKKIDEIGLSSAKYVLDNTGFFKKYTYSNDTKYHHLCDGKLIDILNS